MKNRISSKTLIKLFTLTTLKKEDVMKLKTLSLVAVFCLLTIVAFPLNALAQQYDLLIIAPDKFIDELQPLKQFKDATERPTLLVSLSDVEKKDFGVVRDDPEQIKRFIAECEQSFGIKYVMLAGDSDTFPVRYCKAYKTEWGNKYYPSDLYYMDLYDENGYFDDWDGNGNNIIGEMDFTGGKDLSKVNIDNINMYPDIAVARVPASSETEISAYVNKVISYEQQVPATWFNNALLVVDGGESPFGVESKMDGIVPYLSGFNVEKFYHDNFPYNILNDTQRTHAINAAINSGVGFINYLGHGHRLTWQGWYLSSDIAALTNNSGMLPIVFATSCYTGRFHFSHDFRYLDKNGVDWNGSSASSSTDHPEPMAVQPSKYDAHGDESLAEHFLVKSATGAVGYIGFASRSEHGAWSSSTRGLSPYFFESYDQGEENLGDLWKNALEKFITDDVIPEAMGNYTFIHIHKAFLFGDPSLKVGGGVSVCLPGADLFDDEIYPNGTLGEPRNDTFNDRTVISEIVEQSLISNNVIDNLTFDEFGDIDFFEVEIETNKEVLETECLQADSDDSLYYHKNFSQGRLSILAVSDLAYDNCFTETPDQIEIKVYDKNGYGLNGYSTMGNSLTIECPHDTFQDGRIRFSVTGNVGWRKYYRIYLSYRPWNVLIDLPEWLPDPPQVRVLQPFSDPITWVYPSNPVVIDQVLDGTWQGPLPAEYGYFKWEEMKDLDINLITEAGRTLPMTLYNADQQIIATTETGVMSAMHFQSVSGNEEHIRLKNLLPGIYVLAFGPGDFGTEYAVSINAPMYSLSVNHENAGTGVVTSDPDGISCGSDCSESYEEGAVVTLTATPDTGSIFKGWSGGECSGTGICTVTMGEDTTVTAHFSTLFWPMAYDKMWGDKKNENLKLLRSFRDGMLTDNAVIREHLLTLYGNSLEVLLILVQDPGLLVETKEFVDELLPGVQSLLDGGTTHMPQQQISNLERLLTRFESKASPELKAGIRKVRRDIETRELFEELGIVVSE